MAGVTGLEPAASGVTGQRSNQLSYTPALGAPMYDLAAWVSRPIGKNHAKNFASRRTFRPAACAGTKTGRIAARQRCRAALPEGRYSDMAEKVVGGDRLELPTLSV